MSHEDRAPGTSRPINAFAHSPAPQGHTSRPLSDFPPDTRKLRRSGLSSLLALRMLRGAQGEDLKTIGREKPSSARLRPPQHRSNPQSKARLSRPRPAAHRAPRQNLSSIRLRREGGEQEVTHSASGRRTVGACCPGSSRPASVVRHRSVGRVPFTHAWP